MSLANDQKTCWDLGVADREMDLAAGVWSDEHWMVRYQTNESRICADSYMRDYLGYLFMMIDRKLDKRRR